MERVILTNYSELHWWDYTQYYNNYKPCGLWYSFGSEWADFVKNNLPEKSNTKNKIILNVNFKKILLLDSKEKCISFYEKYHYTGEEIDFPEINWSLVADEYYGIEVKNFNNFRPESPKREKEIGWLYGWDVSSGCIWNMSAIKSYKVYTNDFI